MRLTPERVIPEALAKAVEGLGCWFVIGGHAVRCFVPYRPTRHVDFGVGNASDMQQLLQALSQFVPHTEERRLNVAGILATKLHAILDRGMRRDFFDLYVMLQEEQLGIAECIAAIRKVYAQPVPEPAPGWEACWSPRRRSWKYRPVAWTCGRPEPALRLSPPPGPGPGPLGPNRDGRAGSPDGRRCCPA